MLPDSGRLIFGQSPTHNYSEPEQLAYICKQAISCVIWNGQSHAANIRCDTKKWYKDGDYLLRIKN
jgi:hypothetical protein